jgi:tetratricopeptide (TPR) repeat protein
MYLTKSSLYLLLIVMAAIGSSCAHSPQHSVFFSEDLRSRSGLSQAKAYLSSGNYKKALDIYAAACDDHTDDDDMLDMCADVLESVKAEADKVYESHDYAKAGELYNMLLKSGFDKKHRRSKLSFDNHYLTMRIGACSKMLIELGIMKYREGDLQQAIAIWKNILVFKPSEQEAKTAIDRATAQLQNLKQIK